MANDAPTASKLAGQGNGSSARREPYVVGIGASAGGLDALRTVFSRIPATPGMSFVVVVHLSPQHESHLVELLQPYSRMPVQQVTETVPLVPNRVYVIPPNANLSAIDTHLRLSKLEERRGERAPIDHFFRTLAATHDGRSVGVVLTGGGSDGALGLRQIKEHGGLTIAQDPDEAEHGSMPRTAIATGMVDVVVPVREIATEILKFCSTDPRLQMGDDDGAIDDGQSSVLDEILDHLRMHTGQEIAVYKRATILRRIRRRMQLRHVDTLAAYLEVLLCRADEPGALVDDLSLTVTEFFHDPLVFSYLEAKVVPRLFDAKDTVDRVRVWSIGCSTGEEAYSLAMLLQEEATRRESTARLQVFASDWSEDLLQRARRGVYPHEVAATVSAERLARFFVENGGECQVCSEIRNLVVFAEQNVFRDPPYSHLDMIVCRNLLRDLQPEVRRGVVNLFYYALQPHGVLVLGTDDGLDEGDLFFCEDARTGVFRRRRGSTADVASFASLQPFARRPAPGTTFELQRADDGLAALHEQLAARFVPPSLLVDAANEIVHYSPRASAFIRIPGGDPTYDVLKLVREPLCSVLRIGIDLVRREGRSWRSPQVPVSIDGGRRVALQVEPADVPGRPGLLLIVFDEREARRAPPREAPREATALATITRLEAEIERVNERLRALVEDDGGHREELTASNEDLQSSNQELRFILEELEQSKEEIQAANEELIALDAENRRQIDDFAELAADLRHLLESTGVATLFLDRDLRIVRFTPQIGELFRIQQADRNRPLSDLTHGLDYPDLADDARRVVAHVVPMDREVEGHNGRSYLARMLPYRTQAGAVEGVVLTLIDITDRKRAEEGLRDADRRKDEFLALLAHELRNPLAPITTGIEVLKMAGSDPKIVAQVSATMARQTKTLVRLVDDLLDVSRVSGGRLRLNRAPAKVADLVRDAVAAVRPLVERAGHELTITVPDEPIVLNVDATRLVQVIGNLLNNAARYTPKGGQIEISAARSGDQAVIVVEDNGVGMPEDVRGRVFEMFFQGNDTRVTRNAGLGIGLTLAKSLVEMHDGTIAVDSAGIDRGSKFTVRLPIAAVTESAGRAAPGGPRSAMGGHRVLIVDDNVDAAQTLFMLVKTFGENQVQMAHSGAEALAVAVEMQPDIVFLDLKMPGMDGYEVARRLRQQPGGKDIWVVALTGFGQDDHKRRTKEAGFDRHLTKPADRAALETVLARPPPAAQPSSASLA